MCLLGMNPTFPSGNVGQDVRICSSQECDTAGCLQGCVWERNCCGGLASSQCFENLFVLKCFCSEPSCGQGLILWQHPKQFNKITNGTLSYFFRMVYLCACGFLFICSFFEINSRVGEQLFNIFLYRMDWFFVRWSLDAAVHSITSIRGDPSNKPPWNNPPFVFARSGNGWWISDVSGDNPLPCFRVDP